MISSLNLARLGAFLVVVVMGSAVYTYGRARENTTLTRLIPVLLGTYALAHIIFQVFLWFNHLSFPLNLEAMELLMVEHLARAVKGLPIYVEPSPDFTALAYNPLYYYLTVPFTWVFGTNLISLRLVAILGVIGSVSVIFLAVRRITNSKWWALMAVGLFAASYRAMDTYLDNAHADSWLLFTILLGIYLISLGRSFYTNMTGIVLLVSAFWLKQHGALFVFGGVLYLTWREGWRKSWPYWLAALFLGPALYLAVPDWLFGTHFHFFTWKVPSGWSEFSLSAVRRLIGFIGRYYVVLALLSLWAFAVALREPRHWSNIWFLFLPIALFSMFTGALDPENNNNVFIPFATWLIISGIIGLKRFVDSRSKAGEWGLHFLALGASFVFLLYNPQSVVVPSQAEDAYEEMVAYLGTLDGPVYAPWLGQLQNDYEFQPAIHWVPIYDLIRGPGIDVQNHPLTRALLEPVLNPGGQAFVLTTYPLEEDLLMGFLTEKYVLDSDLGVRFAALTTLPKRYNLAYPRYVYRYIDDKALEQPVSDP